jgi:hypothetical protein
MDMNFEKNASVKFEDYTQKSTYFCKKDKKVSDTGREGGGEDRVSR